MDIITECREHIDKIDNRLVELLNLRFTFCKMIGQEKKRINVQTYDPNREQAIIDKLSQDEEYPGMVEALWPAIMDFSKSLQ